MLTNVYVDGFNLYYSCLKGTPYKWLDIASLVRAVFPQNEIHRIRYFTARVRASEEDPQKPQRQDIFLRALQTTPNLSIHFGEFLSHRVRMPIAGPAPGGARTVEVIKTEEKGSDVNLATFLLVDAFEADYEVAIVISNDSDLVQPIRIVRERCGLGVGILNPQMDRNKTSWAPMKAATFYRRVRRGVLESSQFPPTLEDTQGVIHKPAGW